MAQALNSVSAGEVYHMVKRRSLIWLALATVALLLIAGYAMSQPAPGTGPGLPPSASATPPGPGGVAGGPPGAAPGAGPAGAKPGAKNAATMEAALSKSSPEEIKEGLRRALAMIASGQLEGRVSEPYFPGVVSATYGVKTPQPVAVWVVKPPDPKAPPNLPPESRIDRQEAARMLWYFSLRYDNPLSPWAERQKDFDLQIAGELQRQTNGLAPFLGAPPPPGGPPSAPAGGPPGAPGAPGASAMPGAGAPAGGPPGAPPGGPPAPPA